MNKNTISRAFTLIELLVVISVIGVLSSVVMAALSNARDKGTIGAAQNFDGHTYAAFYDDLVAAWDFNNDSGTTARDQSGNGNDLTLTDSSMLLATPNPFLSGKVLKLDPGLTTPLLAVTSQTLKNITTSNGVVTPPTLTDFSVSFWLYLGDNADGTMFLDLISNSWAVSAGKWKVSIQNNNITFTTRESAILGHTTNPGIPILPNKWYQIVAVCNALSTKNGLYINGKLSATSVASVGMICNFANDVNLSDLIRIPGTVSTPKLYYVDNVRIYKKPLPVSVIQETYLAEVQKYENLAKNNK